MEKKRVESGREKLCRLIHGIEPVGDDFLDHSLALINAPDSMRGLYQIASNISVILTHCSILNDENPVAYQQITKLVRLIKQLSISPDHKADSVFGDKGKLNLNLNLNLEDNFITPPLHGLANTHPVYCALWFKHHDDDKDIEVSFQRLQAQLFIAFVRINISGSPKQIRSAWIRDASRCLRQVATGESMPLLDYIDIENNNPREWGKALCEIYQKKSDEDKPLAIEKYAGAFAALLHFAWPDDAPYPFSKSYREERWGRGKGRGNISTVIKQGHSLWNLLVSSDPEEPWPDSQPWSPQGRQPGESNYEIEGDDIPSAEWEESDDTVFIPVGAMFDEEKATTDPGKLPPLATRIIAARACARHVAMSNQRLRTEWRRFQSWQGVNMLLHLDQVFEKACKNTDILSIETIIIAGIIMVTASDLNSAVRIILADSKKSLPKGYKLAYSPRHNVWVRPALHHPLKSLLPENSIFTESWGAHVVLPDISGVGRHLARLAEQYNLNQGEKFFRRKPLNIGRCYSNLAADHLKSIGLLPRWCSINGMGNAFYDWLISRQEGSFIIPQLLTNRADYLGQVALFYASISRQKLADIYVSEWSSFMDKIESEGYDYQIGGLFKSPGVWTEKKILSNTGAQEVVTFTTVEQLVLSALSDIRIFKDLPHAQFHRKAHNALTSYLGLILSIVVGFRSANTPILDLTHFDRVTGFMVLQEKDQRSNPHGRIVWLPMGVRLLIERYLRHLLALAELRATEKAPYMNIKATKTRDKGHGAWRKIDLRKTLFYLNEEGHAIEFSGRNLANFLGPGYVTDNAGRRFFRSGLTALGCPEAIINAVMGHWSRGEGVWERLSTFDPTIYREQMSHYMGKLLDQVGFDPLDEYKRLH